MRLIGAELLRVKRELARQDADVRTMVLDVDPVELSRLQRGRLAGEEAASASPGSTRREVSDCASREVSTLVVTRLVRA